MNTPDTLLPYRASDGYSGQAWRHCVACAGSEEHQTQIACAADFVAQLTRQDRVTIRCTGETLDEARDQVEFARQYAEQAGLYPARLAAGTGRFTGRPSIVVTFTRAMAGGGMSALATCPDALWYARQAIADAKDHDDATILAACRTVEADSDDADEIAQARQLREFIRGGWSSEAAS